MNKRFTRWYMLIVSAALLAPAFAHAADTNAPAAAPNTLSLTSSAPASRPDWQKHLTLGAGDSVNFALYIDDTLQLPRENVIIGPDGRVSYLEAQNVMAAGLTIEELRDKMDSFLAKFHRSARTVIIPAAIRSKKYYVLGTVVNKGVFTLDRPMTVIEALARSGGLETGVFDRGTVEMADLSHSFIVRHGQRVPVDFERLFQQGDLSQNIPIEPDDYLYFASAGANEVYILGDVGLPGTMPYGSSASAIGAITSRGGFGPKAYQSKVLVVRGSLNHPETFVLNTNDILAGKARDLKLEPRDIIYVSRRPWARAEELLDDGTRAFIEAFVVTYSGAKVGPFIEPIVH